MKKLLVLSASLITLSACAGHSINIFKSVPNSKASIEKAMKECHKELGNTPDRPSFDDCMKQKGFDRATTPATDASRTNSQTTAQ